MKDFFWSNTIWYILLGVLTVIELIVIFLKTDRVKFVAAFYLTLTGVTLSAETVLFIIFRAYYYYPMIIQTSSFDDALAGNLFSQFSLAATALLVAVLNLPNYWIFIFAGIYGLIEELFLMLGIYKHYWYSTWMTLVALPLLFWVAKKYYLKIFSAIKPGYHYLNIFLGLFSLDVITVLWGFMLSGKQNYTRDFFPDSLGSPYVMALLYYCFLSITLMTAYFFKLRWEWKALVILFIYGFNYLAYLQKVIYLKEGWFFTFSTISVFCMYLSIVFLDRMYKNKPLFAGLTSLDT
ncbi:hypothetical protein REC12_04070 [Desulfosporosinus sp. PR]|uniref:hypothetical protein n=1 Tax=Candidatus Desulfosporosinus nitrosoreducens TaxID=3401928 RepID=UPI0027FDD691|nr:hypothetical protein [Desulfosporosinus sp. PR]MDQ7092755.1 hypothetical protein [Desulfosporosinus sp. PR]